LVPEYIGSAGIGASDAVDAVLIMMPPPLRCACVVVNNIKAT